VGLTHRDEKRKKIEDTKRKIRGWRKKTDITLNIYIVFFRDAYTRMNFQ